MGGVLVDEVEAARSGGDDVGVLDLAEGSHDGGAEARGGFRLLIVRRWGRTSAGAEVAGGRGRTGLPIGVVGREEELVDNGAVEAGGGDLSGGGEGAADGGGEAAEDFAGAAEADFGLGGVDVDVDFFGGNRQIQHDYRESAGRHDASVSLADSGGEEPVADPAPVDEEGDVGAGGALEVGLRDEAVDAEGFSGREFDEFVD